MPDSCEAAIAAVPMMTAAASAPDALTLDERTTGFALVTTSAEWLQPVTHKATRKGVRAIFL